MGVYDAQLRLQATVHNGDTRVPNVPIEEIEPGAVLLRPIEDSMGRVLIQAGESLTEQLLNVLKRRGYVELDIRAEEGQSASEEISSRLSGGYSEQVAYDSDVLKMKEELARLFHNVSDDNREMMLIKGLAENIRIGQIVATKGLQ